MSANRLHGNAFAMAALLLMCAAMTWMCALSVQAADRERGRALYENQCQSCHEKGVHSRANRKAKSLVDLRQRAAAWSTHGGLDWSSEEINDVADYLNARFYHFK